jgi:hypothetical protein
VRIKSGAAFLTKLFFKFKFIIHLSSILKSRGTLHDLMKKSKLFYINNLLLIN